MAHMPVKRRLAYPLLSLKKKFGISKEGYFDIILSRQDHASYVGATYETVFRTLGELSTGNIIGFQVS
jgi:CRP/FNR family transcriptional regulator